MKKDDSALNAEKFREMIHKNYKECMMDCQIPTGALAVLNPAEFFAFRQWEDNKNLRQDVMPLSEAILEIHEAIPKVTREIDISNYLLAIAKKHLPYKGVCDLPD